MMSERDTADVQKQQAKDRAKLKQKFDVYDLNDTPKKRIVKENGSKCDRRGTRLCRCYCRYAYTHLS